MTADNSFERQQAERMLAARNAAAHEAAEAAYPLVEGVSGNAGAENARRLEHRREVWNMGPLAIRAAEQVIEDELDRATDAERNQMQYKKQEERKQ